MPSARGSGDELRNVFNLVDANAAAELEAELAKGEGSFSAWDAGRLQLAVNGFLDQYREEYDFLFFVTDHQVAENASSFFDAVNQDGLRGTGHDIVFRRPGYKTNGRLKGVAAFQYVPGGYAPFAHSLLHYWANHLDANFGLGVGADLSSGLHWGYSDIHGQLGGYDPAHFECETPKGASPPDCAATSAGRYRYIAQPFGADISEQTTPYAPFELYLMGLLPSTEAPPTIHVLENGALVSSGKNVVLEADGIHELSITDIIAKHGEVELRAADSREFKAALVVVSAEPASEEVLVDVAYAIAAFGDRRKDVDHPSFKSLTGGRATLDTRLGPRRLPSDEPATETPLAECDVLAQNCKAAGDGCYFNGPKGYCALSAGYERDKECTASRQCAPGMDCVKSPGKPRYYCEPFCDISNPDSPVYCPDLCKQYVTLARPDGTIFAGRCSPE